MQDTADLLQAAIDDAAAANRQALALERHIVALEREYRDALAGLQAEVAELKRQVTRLEGDNR